MRNINITPAQFKKIMDKIGAAQFTDEFIREYKYLKDVTTNKRSVTRSEPFDPNLAIWVRNIQTLLAGERGGNFVAISRNSTDWQHCKTSYSKFKNYCVQYGWDDNDEFVIQRTLETIFDRMREGRGISIQRICTVIESACQELSFVDHIERYKRDRPDDVKKILIPIGSYILKRYNLENLMKPKFRDPKFVYDVIRIIEKVEELQKTYKNLKYQSWIDAIIKKMEFITGLPDLAIFYNDKSMERFIAGRSTIKTIQKREHGYTS